VKLFALGIWIGGFLLGLWLLSAWALMIMAGVAHDGWWSFVPSMGWTVSMEIAALWLAIAVFGGIFQALGAVARTYL